MMMEESEFFILKFDPSEDFVDSESFFEWCLGVGYLERKLGVHWDEASRIRYKAYQYISYCGSTYEIIGYGRFEWDAIYNFESKKAEFLGGIRRSEVFRHKEEMHEIMVGMVGCRKSGNFLIFGGS